MCCGGNGGPILSAKQNGIGGLYKAMAETNNGSAANDAVRLHFLGRATGSVMYKGFVTGKEYYAGATPTFEYIDVAPDDVAHFLELREGRSPLFEKVEFDEETGAPAKKKRAAKKTDDENDDQNPKVVNDDQAATLDDGAPGPNVPNPNVEPILTGDQLKSAAKGDSLPTVGSKTAPDAKH